MIPRAPSVSVEAVIFDMDGLMFDTERLAVDAWIAAGGEAGYEIDESVVLRTIGLAKEGTKEILVREYGRDFPFDSIRERRIRLVSDLIAERGVPIKEGLVELLRFLDERSIPLAVATSTDRKRVRALVESCGISSFFTAMVCGDEVTRNKPDPEIFLKAARALGRAPEGCAVLEDSPNGVAAAYAAGMLPIVVPDLVEPDELTLGRARAVFRNLTQVRDYLARTGMLV